VYIDIYFFLPTATFIAHSAPSPYKLPHHEKAITTALAVLLAACTALPLKNTENISPPLKKRGLVP